MSDLTTAEIDLLVKHFQENWRAADLWEACHDYAHFGAVTNDEVRKFYIDDNPDLKLAMKLGIVDQGWLDSLFANIDALRPVWAKERERG